MRNIKIAKTNEDILATFPVMSQLRPHISKANYVRVVRMQQKEVGFQLSALKDGNRITCVAGFRVCLSLGWGKFLYVDDLVTESAHRSKGAGKKMFDWLMEYARSIDCVELRLDSALERHDAHRFYLRERMDIVCFHFRLTL